MAVLWNDTVFVGLDMGGTAILGKLRPPKVFIGCWFNSVHRSKFKWSHLQIQNTGDGNSEMGTTVISFHIHNSMGCWKAQGSRIGAAVRMREERKQGLAGYHMDTAVTLLLVLWTRSEEDMFCTHMTSSTKDRNGASKDTVEFHSGWINDILPRITRSCRTLKKKSEVAWVGVHSRL